MKVLLTGSTGFLGKNLYPEISRRHKAIGVQTEFYDLRRMDMCMELIKLTRPDVIVHAAGSVGGIQANKENPGKFMYDNLAMGMNIVESARQYKVPKLILLGTVCSYPKNTPVPFNEGDLWEGYPEETNAPYGIAKKTLMKLTEAYHEQYGMNCINLVPVNMYGPHDHFNLTSSHVVPALILKIYNAMKNRDSSINIWGSGRASREFLFVEDCAHAINLAIEADATPEPINIGTGKEIKICDLVTEIVEQMGFDGDVHYDTSKPEGQQRRCLDISRAKHRLGFEAKTGLQEGLSKTIEWFLSCKKHKI